jgi:hypothetical protein
MATSGSSHRDLDAMVAMLRSTTSATATRRVAVSPAVGVSRSDPLEASTKASTAAARPAADSSTRFSNPADLVPRYAASAGPVQSRRSAAEVISPPTRLERPASPPRSPTRRAGSPNAQLFLPPEHFGSTEERWAMSLRKGPFTPHEVEQQQMLSHQAATSADASLSKPLRSPPRSAAALTDETQYVSPPRHRVKFVPPNRMATVPPARATTHPDTSLPSVRHSRTSSTTTVTTQLAAGNSRRGLTPLERELWRSYAAPLAPERAEALRMAVDASSSLPGDGNTGARNRAAPETPPREAAAEVSTELSPNHDDIMLMANIERLQRRLDAVTSMKDDLEASRLDEGDPHLRGSMPPSKSLKQTPVLQQQQRQPPQPVHEESSLFRPAASRLQSGRATKNSTAPPHGVAFYAALLDVCGQDETDNRDLVVQQELLARERAVAVWRRAHAAIAEADEREREEQERQTRRAAEAVRDDARARHRAVAEERARLEAQRAALHHEEETAETLRRLHGHGTDAHGSFSTSSLRSQGGANVSGSHHHHRPSLFATLARNLELEEADERSLHVDREALFRDQAAREMHRHRHAINAHVAAAADAVRREIDAAEFAAAQRRAVLHAERDRMALERQRAAEDAERLAAGDDDDVVLAALPAMTYQHSHQRPHGRTHSPTTAAHRELLLEKRQGSLQDDERDSRELMVEQEAVSRERIEHSTAKHERSLRAALERRAREADEADEAGRLDAAAEQQLAEQAHALQRAQEAVAEERRRLLQEQRRLLEEQRAELRREALVEHGGGGDVSPYSRNRGSFRSASAASNTHRSSSPALMLHVVEESEEEQRGVMEEMESMQRDHICRALFLRGRRDAARLSEEREAAAREAAEAERYARELEARRTRERDDIARRQRELLHEAMQLGVAEGDDERDRRGAATSDAPSPHRQRMLDLTVSEESQRRDNAVQMEDLERQRVMLVERRDRSRVQQRLDVGRLQRAEGDHLRDVARRLEEDRVARLAAERDRLEAERATLAALEDELAAVGGRHGGVSARCPVVQRWSEPIPAGSRGGGTARRVGHARGRGP